jgi:serine/threonine protein kinase
MAEVFRAKAVGHAGFEKIVALKCILPHLANDREFVGMFIDEARTVAQLSHANICQIFELGQAEGTYFIAMELVEGKDLKRIMEYHRLRGRVMPLPVALYIISRTCEALDYAHSARATDGAPLNIVHRDVSPQNVLLSWEGEVKLIDFGIAKAATRLTRTEAGNVKGKFSYISPEQLAGQPATPRSDIFTCSIVLYELITNSRLFRGETDVDTVRLVRHCRVAPPSQLNPRLPPGIDQILLRALARDPEVRPATAGELLDELEALAAATDGPCTGHQVARWMNDTFGQERQRALELERDRADEQGEASEPATASRTPQIMLLSQPKTPAASSARGSLEIVVSPALQDQVLGALDTVPTVQVAAEAVLGDVQTEPDSQLLHTAADATVLPISATSRSGTDHVRGRRRWLIASAVVTLFALGALGFVLWSRGRTGALPRPDPTTPPRPSAIAVPLDVGPTDVRPDAPLQIASAVRAPAATRRPARLPPSRPIQAGSAADAGAASPAGPRPDTAPRGADAAGQLIVSSRPWARVWIDGKDTGRYTPVPLAAPLWLSAGSHRVGLQVGQQSFEYSVTITGGGVTKLIKDLTNALDAGS